ncbi:MAG: glucosamine-6-phosphate deaminase [Bacillota bacterium]
MEIIITADYNALSRKAAGIVAEQVLANKNSVLGLATGSTTEGMYSVLVRKYRQGNLDFNEIITYNLDEYLDLSPDHPQSYYYFMYDHFFNHINIKSSNINIPCADKSSPERDCLEYDQRIIDSGGIDLQVLGIGTNGHIGFNEPNRFLSVNTHVVDLAEETIEANSRFFKSREEMPRRAVTMGLGSIMKAKRILLLASGSNKAGAIKGMLSGKVSTQLPASLLQLHHDLLIVLDREAAYLL